MIDPFYASCFSYTLNALCWVKHVLVLCLKHLKLWGIYDESIVIPQLIILKQFVLFLNHFNIHQYIKLMLYNIVDILIIDSLYFHIALQIYNYSQWNKIIGIYQRIIFYVIPIFDTQYCTVLTFWVLVHSNKRIAANRSHSSWTRTLYVANLCQHIYISITVQEDCVGALWIRWQVLAWIIMEFKYTFFSAR